MFIKKITLAVMTLNLVLAGMVIYAVGHYVGQNTPTAQVDQVAINYAVYEALKGN